MYGSKPVLTVGFFLYVHQSSTRARDKEEEKEGHGTATVPNPNMNKKQLNVATTTLEFPRQEDNHRSRKGSSRRRATVDSTTAGSSRPTPTLVLNKAPEKPSKPRPRSAGHHQHRRRR